MNSKNYFYIGITLLTHSISLMAIFMLFFKKKKALLNALLGVSVLSAAIGTSLVYLGSKDNYVRRSAHTPRNVRGIADSLDAGYVFDDYDF